MTDDLQLDPVSAEHIAGHLCRQHCFLDRVATRGVGQDLAIQLTDKFEKLTALLASRRFPAQ